MPEQLLTQKETAARLNITPRYFRRIRTKLIARGLQVRYLGTKILCRESSVDKLIAARSEAVAALDRKLMPDGWTKRRVG